MSTIDFHSLAKTELHCHLDGSLSLPIIRQLAAMANIDLPASDEELKHHVTAPAHCENLLDYLEAFDYIRPSSSNQEALTLAAYDVAKQAALEMSSTSRFVLHQNCPWTRTHRPRNYRCCL